VKTGKAAARELRLNKKTKKQKKNRTSQRSAPAGMYASHLRFPPMVNQGSAHRTDNK
jgi:hypothetical protein